ncbi:MAG: TetR/AcrR family transcriptional regulator [Clostridia bacterium]|nr:TetR/AcrR family transcriptional regulator [Clostridia bacterium]MBR5753369.1 TetR/AcrR family transcriptional regulator [Clostridia bacterium]
MRPRMESEQIYEAAIPFFARYGFKKTTLDDIAGALGMSNTNIYLYAKSKQDLYEGCIQYAKEKWQDYVRQQSESIEEPKEKLLATFRSAVAYLIFNEDVLALLRNDPSIFPMLPDLDPVAEYNDWTSQYVKEILDDGIEKGVFRPLNTTITSVLLFGWYKYIILSALGMKEETLSPELLEETLTTMSSLLFNGLLEVPEE